MTKIKLNHQVYHFKVITLGYQIAKTEFKNISLVKSYSGLGESKKGLLDNQHRVSKSSLFFTKFLQKLTRNSFLMQNNLKYCFQTYFAIFTTYQLYEHLNHFPPIFIIFYHFQHLNNFFIIFQQFSSFSNNFLSFSPIFNSFRQFSPLSINLHHFHYFHQFPPFFVNFHQFLPFPPIFIIL